jgi:hypothetical protein
MLLVDGKGKDIRWVGLPPVTFIEHPHTFLIDKGYRDLPGGRFGFQGAPGNRDQPALVNFQLLLV